MRRTILLADDSPTIRRLVTHTFADANFRIVEVNNGDAAIKSFEEVRPSVVLADIYMPGKNGYQVCAYIRSHEELNKTPVILLVGAFEVFDEDTAKQAGATASIKKPFEPTALIELVNSILPPDVDETMPIIEPEPALQPELQQPILQQPVLQPVLQSVSRPVEAGSGGTSPAVALALTESEDLLGLESIFKDETQLTAAGTITEEDIDRIADRVIQRLSTQVIESIAWDIVPDITEKIVREELKRIDES